MGHGTAQVPFNFDRWKKIMPCTKHDSLMVCFVPFHQGPAPRGSSQDKAHVKSKEPARQRDFMINIYKGEWKQGEGRTYIKYVEQMVQKRQTQQYRTA